MLNVAAATLSLLGFLLNFGIVQCRSTGGRAVGTTDSGNQADATDARALCLLSCALQEPRMESEGIVKVYRDIYSFSFSHRLKSY